MLLVPCSYPDAVLSVTNTGVLRLNRQLINKTLATANWLRVDALVAVNIVGNQIVINTPGDLRIAKNGKGLAVYNRHLAYMGVCGSYKLVDQTTTHITLEKEKGAC